MASTERTPSAVRTTGARPTTVRPTGEVVLPAPGEPGLLDVPAEPGIWSRLGAEAFGTFALVLVILSTGLYLAVTGLGTLGGALATGLVLAGLIASLGHISGGHFNPAVSLGAALTGRLGWLDMLGYWLAQVIGAVAAATILFVTFPQALAIPLTGDQAAGTREIFGTVSNGWGEQSPLFAQLEQYTTQAGVDAITFDLRVALIMEAVATAIFVAVTIGVVHRRAAVAVGPFAVGATLSAMLLVTGLVTGGGVNPARSTASAIFAGGEALGQLWLFWVAPLLGAAIVGLFAMAFAPLPAAPAFEYEDDDFEDDDDDADDDDDDDDDDEVDVVTKRP